MASTNKSYAPFLSRPGTTFAAAVGYIADVCGYSVGPLPSALDTMTEHRGWCSFGLSLIDLSSIAEQFPGLEWDITKDGLLRMEHSGEAAKVKPAKQLDPFYEVAGKLMTEAQREPGGDIAEGEYDRIARVLDAVEPQTFGLKRRLAHSVKVKLTKWNQKYGKSTGVRPIHTWTDAVNSSNSDIKRGARRALYRAGDAYRKTHP